MIEIVHTLKDIDKKEWNNLSKKDKVENSYEWLSFIQDVDFGMEFTFCHSVCTENGKTMGIIPAYYHNIELRNFFSETGLFFLRKYFPRVEIPLRITKAHIPLSCDFRYLGDPRYFSECLKGLESFSKEKKHLSLVVRDSSEKMNLPEFFCVEIYPEVYVDPYPSWNAYIQSQRGKRGKHMRYEYRKSVKEGTTIRIEENLKGYHNILYDMYMNVCEKHGASGMYPRDFFKKMEDHLSEYTRCIFAENKGNTIAYLFILENDSHISCKYAGRDYSAQDPYVYFRLIYELVKYSIKRKKPVSLEKVSYEAKVRRGFNLREKWNYMKVYYPVAGDLYIFVRKVIDKKITKRIQNIKSLQGER